MENIEELYRIFRECGSVTTDSRTIKGGELFVALKGENFDGNKFALKSLEDGAAYAVANKEFDFAAQLKDHPEWNNLMGRLYLVDDTLIALQQLARHHRLALCPKNNPSIGNSAFKHAEHNYKDSEMHLTVIGLTGTNGKTTTKELINAVLSSKYKVSATKGNLNNSIGVPLTILAIDEDTQIAVVEMGASHPGDIVELVNICEPDFGLITNVGKAHLLGFGSFEGVKKTKGEMYDFLMAHKGMAFLNADDEYLNGMMTEGLEHINYGLKYDGAEVLPISWDEPFVRIRLADCCHNAGQDARIIKTHLVGSYNANNIMAALAVGHHFGVSLDDAIKAIEGFVPSNSRSQMSRTATNTLIIDAYNANPTSMAAALDNFASISAPNKVLMLGDMLELGAESHAEHLNIVNKTLLSDSDFIYLVGYEFLNSIAESKKEIEQFIESGRLRIFENSTDLRDFVEKNPVENSLVLVKGSRGIKMETVLPIL